MKIELCEDNGFLNDGKPTLVVLVIDGKHRIPYEATKTIQELYVDVGKMTDVKVQQIHNFLDTVSESDTDKLLDNINEFPGIEKEDIVKCIKVHPREEGSDCTMEVGNEYRVLSIKIERGKILSYEIVDDSTTESFRMRVFPDEIELLRKRKVKTNPVKKDYKQEIVKHCGEHNVLELVGDTYVGECIKCKEKLEVNLAKPVTG